MSDYTEATEAPEYTDAEERLTETSRSLLDLQLKASLLVVKVRSLADLLEDADKNHGGLIGPKTLRAANELRAELSRWPK